MIDYREANSSFCAHLRSLGHTLSLERLPVGDIIIGDRIIIERKTTRDLLDSLVDGRLLSQCRRLYYSATRPLLIIEGVDLFDTRAVHPNAVQGVLSWITLDLGLSVMMTRSTLETALFISMTAKREEKFLKNIESNQQKKPSHESSLIKKPKKIHHGNLSNRWRRAEFRQTEKMLTSIEGIGPKTAAKLTAVGMTIAKLSAVDFQELNALECLSAAQAKAIYLALHSQPPMTNALVFN